MSQSRGGEDHYEPRGSSRSRDDRSPAERRGHDERSQRSYPDRTRHSEDPRDSVSARGAQSEVPEPVRRLEDPRPSRNREDDTRSDVPPAVGGLQDPQKAARSSRDNDQDDMPSEIGRLQDPKGPSKSVRHEEDDVAPEVERLQDPSGPSEHPPPEVDRLQDPRGPSRHPEAASSGKSTKSRGNRSSIDEEIVYMEAQTWEGLKSSGKSLLPFLAPDCLMIFPGAAILDARSTPSLREILTRSDMRPWTHYEMDNVHVIRLGSASASISYEVEARRKEERYEAMITSIWRKDAETGEWKMCMHQQTPINVV